MESEHDGGSPPAPPAPGSDSLPRAPSLSLPRLSARLGDAYAQTAGERLTIGTGKVEREWRWTGRGFATTGLRNLETGQEWATGEIFYAADWSLGRILHEDSRCELVSLEARESNDEGFTSRHLEVAAEFRCAEDRLVLQYRVWAYPGAPGLRTQLRVRALAGLDATRGVESGRSDAIPVSLGGKFLLAAGYYNDTQHRNTRETEILREERIAPPLPAQGAIDWASLLAVADGAGGLVLVKESHKCANQQGVDTGAFHYGEAGLWSTGWGVPFGEIGADRFRSCWANWVVLYSGGEDERDLALKTFDRRRYPVDPDRDVYIMANTWGSCLNATDGKYAARQENVLREIASQADLGIDAQQIDDGWQGGGYEDWRPAAKSDDDAHGAYDVYPEGWRNVKTAAQEKGVKLGLWVAWHIPEEDLARSHDKGGFQYYKVDFASLDAHAKIESLMGKVRALVKRSGHRVRVNWDVTENPPRVGYFFGRECGSIYLENRKPLRPSHAVYVPYLVLRDAWQVSKFLNLNRFQVTVQNIDRVNREASDAYKHSHAYVVAQTLMGSPIFFQQTRYYDEAARAQIRPLLALYKEHRQEMFKGFVLPIGEKPDNAGWSGFQNHNPDANAGYLTLFRQIENEEPSKTVRLKFLAGKAIRLTDLERGAEETVTVGEGGEVVFEIDRRADYRFYRYADRQ